MEIIDKNYKSKNTKKKFFILYKIICILLFMKLLQLFIYQINNKMKIISQIKKRWISLKLKKKTENINDNLNNYNNSLVRENNYSLEEFSINNGNISDLQNLLTYKWNFSYSFNTSKFLKNKYFKILKKNYVFSSKYRLVKLEYVIGFFDQNKNLLTPPEMTLYNNLHFACFLETLDNKTVNSLAYIYLAKYIKCIEYFKFGEKIKFGLTIFENKSFFQIFFSTEDVINYNDITHENDDVFNPKIIKSKYISLRSKIKTDKNNKAYSLKKMYLIKPIINLRRNQIQNISKWHFGNFYNEYFCFCIGGGCFKKNISQKCKYFYYIFIIDKEKYLYPKTDYIFVDFIFKSLTSDDTYPVFEEMMRRNFSAHYITEKDDIFEKYCQNITQCQTIIPINKKAYSAYGDFFEKYLTLVLKTKSFISAKQRFYHPVGYLFYKIEYITYIAVGHGVCYFKDYLFKKFRIYGSKNNDKILIPPSKVLISIAMKYGWKEENIIKLNLPRWDKYNHPSKQAISHDTFSGNITNNSILVMFTWRMNKIFLEHNSKISPFYMQNLTKLLLNKELKKELEANNLTLYVSFHRYLKDTYHDIIKGILRNNSNIKVIEQNDISECLSKTNLVVSDFSSIIFDLMYRNKPFIIYVPDSNDPEIPDLYYKDYIQLIKKMNEGAFKVANKCNTVEETVKKIIYYVKNKFKIDANLKTYFDYFNFKQGNNIDKFINYLLSL